MANEIERTEEPMNNNQNQPEPMQVMQMMVGLQMVTLGFLMTSQILLSRQLRKMSVPVTVNTFTVPLPSEPGA